MKVVILCGGKGTRIRGVDDSLPKPLIPVGNYPIVWHIMRTYAHFGFKDFVLCLGYKGMAIKDFFLNYRAQVCDLTIDFSKDREVTYDKVHEELDWKVTLAETGENTLTGSRVKKIQDYIGDDETFMLTYGDGVCDIDIDELIAFHKSHGKILTVSGVRPPGRFGELEHADDGQIVEFNEKPNATGGRISGGYFVCQREIFDYLDANRDDETLETDPMRNLAKDGQMMMYGHDGFWQCMDTFRDFELLNGLVDADAAPWIKW
ncbi:MAG: glucose-1-phosphate cytidylyltransferase [Rhodospirillaceae bacterium]|nr:MAG: glucose-1-phosphate cytidylyltransferase [Rhodospirillaceae bacterium]